MPVAGGPLGGMAGGQQGGRGSRVVRGVAERAWPGAGRGRAPLPLGYCLPAWPWRGKGILYRFELGGLRYCLALAREGSPPKASNSSRTKVLGPGAGRGSQQGGIMATCWRLGPGAGRGSVRVRRNGDDWVQFRRAWQSWAGAQALWLRGSSASVWIGLGVGSICGHHTARP